MKFEVSIIDRSCCGASVRLRCILCAFELAETPLKLEICNGEDIIVQALLAIFLDTHLDTHTRSQNASTRAQASTLHIAQPPQYACCS
jgi:hypothetical protein